MQDRSTQDIFVRNSAEWSAQDPYLTRGDLFIESDTGRQKVGVGDRWSQTPYEPIADTGALNIASGANAVTTGGYLNTASGQESAIAGGRNNTASGRGSLASGMGAVAYARGMHASAGDYFASPGDAQSIDLTFAGLLTLQPNGSGSSASYQGELYLNLATLERWVSPANRLFFGQMLATVAGPEGQQASVAFNVYKGNQDGTTPANVVSMGGSSGGGQLRRYFSSAPYVTVTPFLSASNAVRVMASVSVSSILSVSSPANTMGPLRCVARLVGVEAGIPTATPY